MWFIRYKAKGTAGIRSVPALQAAVEDACDLLDQGATVAEIKNGAIFGCIQFGRDEIESHYRAKQKLKTATG